MEKVLVDKVLLNVKEVCAYLGIGESKARELLTKTNNNFTVRLGGRVYANKVQLDKWLLNNSGNKVQKRQYFPRKQKKEQEQERSGGMRMIM